MEIIQSGNLEIYEGFGQDGSLIFKAATTCYDSEYKTSKNTNDIIKMLKRKEHTAMLEFMWIALKVNPDQLLGEVYSPFTDLIDIRDYIKDIVYPNRDYLKVGIFKNEIYIYGNARAFYELLLMYDRNRNITSFIVELYHTLVGINYELFDDALSYYEGEIRIPNLFTPIGYEDIMNKNNGYPDCMKWVAFKYLDVSRGMTHELVRHRRLSFAQRSTRYVNHSDMKVVMWMDELPHGLPVEVHHYFTKSEEIYSKLIEAKVPKDIARQVLPTATCADICVAGTISDLNKFWILRTPVNAHREIRKQASDLVTSLTDKDII